jgi:membrane-bound serine protease (ClpP class)
VLGVALLAVWFWGSNIAGLSGMEEVALFILGVIFLLAELFFFPGTMIPGIIGVSLIISSILMAMIQHYPGTPAWPTLPQFSFSVIQFGKSLLISAAGFWLVAGVLPQTPLFRKMVLGSATSRVAGYTASADTSSRVGQRGITETRLNPAGAARFGTERLNVVARGDFINAGEAVIVAETHGNRIIVERTTKA